MFYIQNVELEPGEGLVSGIYYWEQDKNITVYSQSLPKDECRRRHPSHTGRKRCKVTGMQSFDCSHHSPGVQSYWSYCGTHRFSQQQRLGWKSRKFHKAKLEFLTSNMALPHTKCVMDTRTLWQAPEPYGSLTSVSVSIGACLPKYFLFAYCMIKTMMLILFFPWAMFSQICFLWNCSPETMPSMYSNMFRHYK